MACQCIGYMVVFRYLWFSMDLHYTQGLFVYSMQKSGHGHAVVNYQLLKIIYIQHPRHLAQGAYQIVVRANFGWNESEPLTSLHCHNSVIVAVKKYVYGCKGCELNRVALRCVVSPSVLLTTVDSWSDRWFFAATNSDHRHRNVRSHRSLCLTNTAANIHFT